MLLKQQKTEDLQVIQIRGFIESSTKATYQTLTLKCADCFWVCSIIDSFVVWNPPDPVITRGEAFEQSRGEAVPVSPFPPKHTLRFSAENSAFIIAPYNSVGYP